MEIWTAKAQHLLAQSDQILFRSPIRLLEIVEYKAEQLGHWSDCIVSLADPCLLLSLRKHAYSIIYKISPPKTENFQTKTDIFRISAQNIDCWYSLEPPRRV